MSTSSSRLIGIYLGLGTAVAVRLLQLKNDVSVPRWVRRQTTSPVVRQAYVGAGWLAVVAFWPALLTMRTIVTKNREQHGVYRGCSSRWLTLGPRPARELKDIGA